MADLSICFPFFRVVKQMRCFDDAAFAVVTVIVHILNIMQKIIIDMVHAEMIQLTLECLLNLFLGDQHKGRKLRRDGIAFSGMAFHKRFAGRFLAFTIMINKACIKIGITRFQKSIDHFIQLRIIKISGTGDNRKPHHTKTQIFHKKISL